MLAAVTREVAVMLVDHRDARADEARDRKGGDAGTNCERHVGVAQVVEVGVAARCRQRSVPASSVGARSCGSRFPDRGSWETESGSPMGRAGRGC